MSAAHRILGNFDIKPTAQALAVGELPDELMIDWTALPHGAHASIYLPTASAPAMVATAKDRYGANIFTAMDAHTVACAARGITYLPIPQASGNLAGFVDVSLPATVKQGRKYGITLRQLSTAQAVIGGDTQGGGVIAPQAVERAAVIPTRPRSIAWRKVVGECQLALAVADRAKALATAEEGLALLGWILAAMTSADRWRPLIIRYLEALASQIRALSGDPTRIKPSPYGVGGEDGGHPGHDGHGRDGERHDGAVGKIEGLVFDHFGDFSGFILETEEGGRRHFVSRERAMEEVARRAWAERLLVTVIPEAHNEHHPHQVILHPPSDHPLAE
jgi:hypothetical protein